MVLENGVASFDKFTRLPRVSPFFLSLSPSLDVRSNSFRMDEFKFNCTSSEDVIYSTIINKISLTLSKLKFFKSWNDSISQINFTSTSKTFYKMIPISQSYVSKSIKAALLEIYLTT